MDSRVRVLGVSHVQPELPGRSSTSHPPPPDHDAIKLSLFDTLLLALPPIRRLFLYDGADLPPFLSLARSLRSSLAATLAVFFPLAGKLTASSDSDDVVVIDCSDGAVSPGVKFVEAEYPGGADGMRRLARDVEHDTAAFAQLVPELEVGTLPCPVLAVQVTRPAAGDGGGAVAVGVSMHHAVADGQSLWQFMRAWAAASREGGSPVGPGLVPPTFDRAGIRHSGAEATARKFVRLSAPALPTVNTLPEPDWTRQSRRTYLLTAGQIQSLKQRIRRSNKAGKNEQAVQPPSTYVAVASLLWTSIVSAKFQDPTGGNNGNDTCYLLFPADCRRHLHPPLDAGYFGNCVKLCYARAAAGDLRDATNDDAALAHAAAAIRRAIREHLEEDDPLGDAERWVEINQGIPRGRMAHQGSSHRFMVYEIDFGWGEPTRVEIVSVFSGEMVMLVGARDGAVQVSVALGRDTMDAFEASFLSKASA